VVDELFFTPDGKSLRRGRRGSKRHAIERLVHIWRPGDEENRAIGVATDISLEGVLVYTSEPFGIGEEVMLDIKRSKESDGPTFIYVRGEIVRHTPPRNGMLGLGIRMRAKERKPD